MRGISILDHTWKLSEIGMAYYGLMCGADNIIIIAGI